MVDVELAPLQLPAPQLELPVELSDVVVESLEAAPLHDALPSPPDVDDVDDSVVDAEPELEPPPPHAESPRSAEAATTSEAFVFMFMGIPSSVLVRLDVSRSFPGRILRRTRPRKTSLHSREARFRYALGRVGSSVPRDWARRPPAARWGLSFSA